MRYPIYGVVSPGSAVTVYNDDGATPATIYAAISGGAALAGGVATADTYGRVIFFVDDTTYPVVSYFVVLVGGTTITGVWSFFATVEAPVAPPATPETVTVLDVCNMALMEIGADEIAALSDLNTRAKACNRLYAGVRSAVQRAYPWNCCMGYSTLTVDLTAPTWGYAYRFSLPSDCLRALAIDDPKVTFKVVGRFIYTNDVSDDLNLRYTKLITDPSYWDALLVQAVVARLASALSIPVSGGKDGEKTKWQLYISKLQEARGVDGQEGSIDSIISTEFTDFRQ